MGVEGREGSEGFDVGEEVEEGWGGDFGEDEFESVSLSVLRCQPGE